MDSDVAAAEASDRPLCSDRSATDCPKSTSSLASMYNPLGSDDRRTQSARNAIALLYIRIYNKWWISASTQHYGERRFQALGLIGDRLHMMVFTPRANKAHVISLRKANKREVKRYEAQA
jgi:hypothetical protein